ncbi:hypothetical protein DFH07DRAFT_951572 [Mycena maculata]|uniref:Uncharacterized protein n=1 Tax=Mycena maculata TaxID=230809 RepID=A0AAD7K4F3_9AGAR|nr:hypothetical protein DFH07DRAFT_951566 [Mycena maculata]KAJ7776953.1 hypothetical protein DFH07DRAFT_951572 [Mycena maculata]
MLLSVRVLKGQRLPEFSQFNSERHKALDSGAQDSHRLGLRRSTSARRSLIGPTIACRLSRRCCFFCAPAGAGTRHREWGGLARLPTPPPRRPLRDRGCRVPLPRRVPPSPIAVSGDARLRCSTHSLPDALPPPKKKSTPRASLIRERLVRERLVRDGPVCDAPAAARLRCRAPPLQHPALPTSPRAASSPPPALAGVPTHEARPPRNRPPTSGSPCAASPPPPRPEASPALTSPTAYKIPARRRAAGNVSYLLTTTTTAPAAYKARLSARHLLLPHHHHRGY